MHTAQGRDGPDVNRVLFSRTASSFASLSPALPSLESSAASVFPEESIALLRPETAS